MSLPGLKDLSELGGHAAPSVNQGGQRGGVGDSGLHGRS